jgi:hypothetical protein
MDNSPKVIKRDRRVHLTAEYVEKLQSRYQSAVGVQTSVFQEVLGELTAAMHRDVEFERRLAALENR